MPRGQCVVDHAHLHRLQEGQRPPGEPVQQVEHGIAPVRMLRVARREVDVRLLAPAAERGTRNQQPVRRAGMLDECRLTGRPEAAVREVVVEVAAETEQANHDEGGDCDGGAGRHAEPRMPERRGHSQGVT